MTPTITINLDNAAFADGGTDEAVEIVTRGLELLRGCWAEIPAPAIDLRDSNGNTVGKAKVVS